MDALILGKGFIGMRLQEKLGCPATADRINRFSDVKNLIKHYKPKVLINCIGHTGIRNVDDCEEAKDKTLFSNTYIPILLGEIAHRRGLRLIHISSGCIHHGADWSIEETEEPDYYSLYYSRSKIYAENVLARMPGENLILRIRIPLDDRPHPKNILTKLLKFDKIIDIPNSITYIPTFLEAVEFLETIKQRGIFNIVMKDPVRYSDILNEYNKTGEQHEYESIEPKDLKLTRTNTVYSTEKLEKSGFFMKKTDEMIKKCVKRYKNVLHS